MKMLAIIKYRVYIVLDNICHAWVSGADLDFWKGGTARFVIIICHHCWFRARWDMYSHSVQLQSMPTLGSGACPPGNFKKLHNLRLNLRAFLVIFITLWCSCRHRYTKLLKNVLSACSSDSMQLHRYVMQCCRNNSYAISYLL